METVPAIIFNVKSTQNEASKYLLFKWKAMKIIHFYCFPRRSFVIWTVASYCSLPADLCPLSVTPVIACISSLHFSQNPRLSPSKHASFLQLATFPGWVSTEHEPLYHHRNIYAISILCSIHVVKD